MLRRIHPRLRIEYSASYAPELNPTEAVWSLAKRQLTNARPEHVLQLVEHVIEALEDIRCSPAKLHGCFDRSELPSFFGIIIAIFIQMSITPIERGGQ